MDNNMDALGFCILIAMLFMCATFWTVWLCVSLGCTRHCTNAPRAITHSGIGLLVPGAATLYLHFGDPSALWPLPELVRFMITALPSLTIPYTVTGIIFTVRAVKESNDPWQTAFLIILTATCAGLCLFLGTRCYFLF